MSSHIKTQFRFYYNASIDKYSCIMDSHTITFSIVILHPLVPGSNTQPSFMVNHNLLLLLYQLPQPQPSGSSLASGTSVLATPKSGQHSRLYPDLEALNMSPHSRPSVHSHIARLIVSTWNYSNSGQPSE
jgi:hypothetical protein